MGFTEPERVELTLRDPAMRAYAQRLLDERKARILAARRGEVDIPLPDLKAAVEARQLVTSKNIVNRPGPEAKYPSRPEGSPFEDKLAREAFEVSLVDPPTDDVLRTAIEKAPRN
jgi:hypothetical protein